MMGEHQLQEHTTVEEYLKLEAGSEFKYEYHGGKIQTMSGRTLNHGLIGGNIFVALRNAIDKNKRDCVALNNDVKLYIDKSESFVYPDAMTICGEIESSDEEINAVINPVLIVEVLSKSTGSYDRGDKFHKYCSLPSFKEYVLIDQYKPVVDILYREDAAYWKMVTTIGSDKSIYLNTLDVHVQLADIYNKARDLESVAYLLS